jgi:hypothetical protein
MASAVVTDIGGPLSHGSIVAREYGIPAVMGTGVATKRIQKADDHRRRRYRNNYAFKWTGVKWQPTILRIVCSFFHINCGHAWVWHGMPIFPFMITDMGASVMNMAGSLPGSFYTIDFLTVVGNV